MVRSGSLFTLIFVLTNWFSLVGPADLHASEPLPKAWTVMCYMNGDNDLSAEVLHAIDMLETVGSSDTVNVLALVDAHPDFIGEYDRSWQSARLLFISTDLEIGRIRSQVIYEPGELNLADPTILSAFVRFCRTYYPAERYVFTTFTHGRGIIDYRSLAPPETCRPLSICPDDTSSEAMDIQQFADAVRRGMEGRPLDLMVFFSCLTNMIEVGYAFKDTTRYLVASEDEIHIVNDPPGRFQIRGIRLDRLVHTLSRRPRADVPSVARRTVDDFISQYERKVSVPGINGGKQWVRYPGTLAVMDSSAYDALARALDQLARTLMRNTYPESADQELVYRFHNAVNASQRYRSFLNLEYYDLTGFIAALEQQHIHPEIDQACEAALGIIRERLVVHERHASKTGSGGVSVYLSHHLIPENVFLSHHSMYKQSRFSQDTAWDEMIHHMRRLRRHQQVDTKPDLHTHSATRKAG